MMKIGALLKLFQLMESLWCIDMWKDVEEDFLYETIEEALLTCCPVCGERIEWSVQLKWNDHSDKPVFYGNGFSCGLIFTIKYNESDDGYNIWIEKT